LPELRAVQNIVRIVGVTSVFLLGFGPSFLLTRAQNERERLHIQDYEIRIRKFGQSSKIFKEIGKRQHHCPVLKFPAIYFSQSDRSGGPVFWL
jgi:hypothetical protein